MNLSQMDKKPSDDTERVKVDEAIYEAVKDGDLFKGGRVRGKIIAGKSYYLQVEKANS